MPRQPRSAAKGNSSTNTAQRIYRVIKPKEFHDHRDAYNGALSFTRPNHLDLKELKVLAISSRNLLDAWKKRHSEGAEHPLKNGFKIQPEHRLEHQAVFRLSEDEQKRLVRNRSFCFWECLNMTNGYDARVLITTIKRIVDPDRYYSKNQPEYTIFPPSKYDQGRFIHSIEANEEWKRSFLTLHQMMKWLKGIIFLHMFSPQFDFRFCEMRYEFSPFNSWNPLPVDPQSNSSLYQTNIQFQKLSDFILIADQIRALERVLGWETANWCKQMDRNRLGPTVDGVQTGNLDRWPITERKLENAYSLLHHKRPEIQMENKDAEFRLLGFDISYSDPKKPLSVLRLLSLINADSIINRKAVVLNFVLDPVSQSIKNLICRSEIPSEHIHHFIRQTIAVEATQSKMIVVDKYIVLYEELDINYTRVMKSGKRRMTQPGPSLTIWDREGNFKECKRKPEDFTSGLSFYLKRLPGRRFALIQKTAFGEARSLIYNLEYREPILYNGEIEDSNQNYFTIRLADHVQFYTFNNKTDKEAEYLFSIRSLLDERIRLCSGGSDRYATSRLSLPYHIQVYNFLPRKTAKLNLSSGQSKAPKKIGQHEELYNCVEPLSYPKPEITMTRPFKQSQSDCTNDDTRLRILATVTGCWQLSDKISENNPPVTNPGDNFSLCPSGILIHDGNHDLLCFQPLELDSKESKTATSHGRILLSLPHQTNTETNENEYFLPIGKCWGRLVGNEMYFYSQSILNGTLAQHRISFGPPKARGFQRKCSTTQNGLIREKRIRWKDQESGQSLEEAFEYLSLQEEEALE